MAELVVITPSRGRPQQLARLLAAIHDTAVTDPVVYIGIDDDDDSDYSGLIGMEVNALVCRGERQSLSGWTNNLAFHALTSAAPPRYLASLGDDHLPRSQGWDLELCGEIQKMGGSGIAYGNDLLQGEKLPTAWVISADIVRTLGWMMLPTCQHMYVDTATLELGKALGRIAYRPDVVIEHLHPLAGKARWDDSYRQTNTHARYQQDEAAFAAWMRDGLAADVAKLQGAPV